MARYDVVEIDPLSAVAAALGLDFDKSNADFVSFTRRPQRSSAREMTDPQPTG